MTRFDAHAGDPAPSTWRDVRAVVAAQPAVFVVTTAICCLVVVIAIGVLAIGQAVVAQRGLTIARTQASVFLAPQLARADAEALRARIEAMPFVARAVLRTREEALSALAGDGMPTLTARPNPLPDVWIVSLRPPGVVDAERALSDDVAAAKEGLAALPGVGSVNVDERWIATVDRWSPRVGRLVAAANALVFAVLAFLLIGVGLIAARAGAARRENGGGIRTFATIGVLSGAASVLIAAAMVWGVATWLESAGVDLKPMVALTGQMLVRLAAAVGVVAILAPLAGMIFGAIRR